MPVRGALLLVVAAAASFAPPAGQLLFAAVAIGVVGLAHGASDLAIVPRPRRLAFLLAYGAVAVGFLLWWVVRPDLALLLFLLASAIHFAVEDAPEGHPVEQVARGIALVGAPACLHRASVAALLTQAGAAPDLVVTMVRGLACAGALGAVLSLGIALRRRDAHVATGTLALLLLPPLPGFSAGFLLLHALPQTRARCDAMRCPTLAAYVVRVLPVLLLAFAGLAGVAWVMLRVDATGTRALFAGIAALAMPHLLVTPLFEAVPDGTSGRSMARWRTADRTGQPLPAIGDR